MKKKFFIKCLIVFLFFAVFIGIPFAMNYYYDTFNVFHWKNIRFTSAVPNENFIKTQYIVQNPLKFNAFVFGSSRVGYLPLDGLPKEYQGTPLTWYNMTYSVGTPDLHYLTIKTFIKNNVNIKMILLGFDELAMHASMDKNALLRMPYQVYEDNKLDFILPYLKAKTEKSIINEVNHYEPEKNKAKTDVFYGFGWLGEDFSLAENPDIERYKVPLDYCEYSLKNAYKDIESIVELCNEHKIKLVLFTNPMWHSLYRESVSAGYFDFLHNIAKKCEFYNFSTLNDYSTNPKYYFEFSHYRPTLGLAVEKYIFGTDAEREKIQRDSADELFGAKMNAENVDLILEKLKVQLVLEKTDKLIHK